MKRKSTAVWRGNGLEGKGSLTTQSHALEDAPYSFQARFVSEDGRVGTNPEELLGAAHAGCFAMALSFLLSGESHPPESLEVTATVQFAKEERGWTVQSIQLDLEGVVPGIDAETFQRLAEKAKSDCPISRALSAIPMTLTARLQ